MEFNDQAGNSASRDPPAKITNFIDQAPRYPQLIQMEKEKIREEIIAAERMRQLEKAKIREEILAAERRRVLEAEVRRELMAEGFPFGGFENASPFQRNVVQPQVVSEVGHISEVEKEKGEFILLAKPDANLSGTKRKVMTPPTEGAAELPLIDGKKRPKGGWNCEICQLSATSEQALNDHLQGKKHRAKVAGLRRPQRTVKNFSIGLSSTPTLPAEVEDKPISAQGGKIERDLLLMEAPLKNKWAAEISAIKEDPQLLGTDSGKKDEEEVPKSKKIISEAQKKKYTFWCEMCQVGAFSEEVMDDHKLGKKHRSRFQKLNKDGGALSF